MGINFQPQLVIAGFFLTINSMCHLPGDPNVIPPRWALRGCNAEKTEPKNGSKLGEDPREHPNSAFEPSKTYGKMKVFKLQRYEWNNQPPKNEENASSHGRWVCISFGEEVLILINYSGCGSWLFKERCGTQLQELWNFVILIPIPLGKHVLLQHSLIHVLIVPSGDVNWGTPIWKGDIQHPKFKQLKQRSITRWCFLV